MNSWHTWPIDLLEDHARWLKLAWEVSEGGTCLRRKVGAVLVLPEPMLKTAASFHGWNTTSPGAVTCEDAGECYLVPSERGPSCVRTVHAEVMAISNALARGYNPYCGAIYLTTDPCINCAKLLASLAITVYHPGSSGYLPLAVREALVPSLSLNELEGNSP